MSNMLSNYSLNNLNNVVSTISRGAQIVLTDIKNNISNNNDLETDRNIIYSQENINDTFIVKLVEEDIHIYDTNNKFFYVLSDVYNSYSYNEINDIINTLVMIYNNNLNNLKNYLNDYNEFLKNNDNAVLLLCFAISNDANIDIIEYLIEQVQFFKVGINKFLFLALSYNKFEIADTLIKYGVNINDKHTNILGNLYKAETLNKKNLNYLFNKNIQIKSVTNYFKEWLNASPNHLQNRIAVRKDKYFIKSLLKHFIFDNAFILDLLNIYKEKKAFTKRQLKDKIQKEKSKLELLNDYYEQATIEKDYDKIKWLFIHDGSEKELITYRINKYKILKHAIEFKDYDFIKYILDWEDLSFKNIISYDNMLALKSCHDWERTHYILNKAWERLSKSSMIYTSRLSSRSTTVSSPTSSPTSSPKISSANHRTNSNSSLSSLNSNVTTDKKYNPLYLNYILNVAIKVGYLELLDYFMTEEEFKPHMNINAKDINGENLIITSLAQGDNFTNKKIFQRLIDYGANCNIKDKNGNPVLSLAMNINPSFVKYILKRKLNINQKDTSGNYPLITAINHNSIENVILLIYYGKENELNMNMKDPQGNNPILLAYKLDHINIFKYLVEKELPELDIDEMDSEGHQVMYYAIQNKDLNTIYYLINHGADVNFLDKNGKVPLQYAIETESIPMLQLLMEHGANKDYIDPTTQESLLMGTVELKNFEVFKAFVDSGADIHYKSPEGLTVLELIINAEINNLRSEDKLSSINRSLYNNLGFTLSDNENYEYSKKIYLMMFNYLFKYSLSHPTRTRASSSSSFTSVFSTSSYFAAVPSPTFTSSSSSSSSNSSSTSFKQIQNLYKKMDDQEILRIIRILISNDLLDFLHIIIRHGFDLNTKDKNGNTALTYAIEVQNERIINHLKNCYSENEIHKYEKISHFLFNEFDK